MTHIHITTRRTYTHTHTRTCIQRSTIFTYYSNPRRSLWISMTLVILFTLYEPTKESRRYRRIAPRIRASMVIQREILCHGHFDKFSFRLLSCFTSPFVTYASSPLSTVPTQLVATLPRAKKRLQAKLHNEMVLRIFELGNEIFTEDPRISRRSPFQLCLYEKDPESENVQSRSTCYR